MPRVKGLTTGSVPSFVDLILNFAESDTSSSLATQDTWLAQIRSHLHPEQGEGRLVFYGDDTWLKLFPDFFAEHDGTSSFFVSVSSFHIILHVTSSPSLYLPLPQRHHSQSVAKCIQTGFYRSR